MHKPLKPAIRFKEFTNDWQQRKLEEIADRYDNLRVPISENMREKGNTPYYGANGIQGYIKGHTHKGEFVLVAEDGANDLKNYPVQYVNGKIWVNNHAHVLKSNKNNSTLFLKYLINANDLSTILVGSDRKKLNSNDLMSMNFWVTDFNEQNNISSLFFGLDTLIALQKRKLEKLKNIKNMLLEKMFADEKTLKPAIRFKEFTNAWEQRRLGDIANTYNGLTGKNKQDFGHGLARYITYLNVFKNEKILINECDSIEIDNRQNRVLYGDLLVTTSSEIPEEVGITSIFPFDTKNMYLNSFCFGIRFNDISKLNIDFLAVYFRSMQIRRKIILLAQGISRFNISKHKFLNINVSFPNKIEQRKIGDLFSDLNSLITLHQRKLEKLKNIKNMLLEKMFI